MSSVLSVRDIVQAIKTSLEFEFSHIQVQGEITNFSASKTGHIYFTLSDSEAALSCALFRGDALRNPIARSLRDGDKIIVSGPLNVYAKRGNFQLICKSIKKAGKGDLKEQFEQLKAKLKIEGLFDLEKKQKIPEYPRRVAVLTAATGAAIQDFVNIIKRRSLWCDIVVVPCLVQGDSAPASLRSGLKKALQLENIELIVLTRGGGSLEDLWAFNDEQLVRDIFACDIPTISAVGHQVDFTLCDFVADLRVETPSAAAELLSEPQTKIARRMQHNLKALSQSFWSFKVRVLEKIEKINPYNFSYLLEKNLAVQSQRLSKLNIESLDLKLGIYDKEMLTEELFERMVSSLDKRHQQQSHHVELLEQSLNNLNPKNVLERGYSYVTSGDSVITSQKEFAKLKRDQNLTLTFYDGVGDVKKT